MKMNKSKLFAFGAFVLVFLLYAILLSVFIETKESSFYIALAFSVLSFAIVLFFMYKGFKNDKILFTYPVFIVNGLYFIGQLILGIIFSILNLDKLLSLWISEIVLLMLFGIAICLLFASKSYFAKQDNDIKEKKTLQFERIDKLELVNTKYDDNEVNSKLISIQEQIRYSDPMCNNSVKDLDKDIDKKIDDLMTIPSKDSALKTLNDLSFLINKRNTILKNSK